MPATELARRTAIAALAACMSALQIYAFHWGVITPDTVVQYGQALTGHYDDWHPPVTAWLWRELLRFGQGGAPFLILDSLLYWTGVALIAAVLRRRAGWVAAAVILLLAMTPIGFGEVGSILKDPLLACLLVMASALILARETSRGVARMALAIAALPLIVIASATRFNALFAALPLLVLLMPPAWSRRPSPAIAAALGAALLLAASTWAINVAALRPDRSQPIFSLVNFDLAGIGAFGGGNAYPSLPDADAAALTAACYESRLYGKSDEELCARPENSLVAYARATGTGAVSIWLRAVTAAPMPYLRHRLAHLNLNWRLWVPHVPDDAVYIMSQPNDLGLSFTPNPVTLSIGRAARVMALSPFGRPATWLALALGLLILAPRLPSRRFVTAIACSALFYGSGYAVVSVAADLRYNLWTMLATMIGLAVAFADGRTGSVVLSRRRLLIAATPAMLAATLEMIALFG